VAVPICRKTACHAPSPLAYKRLLTDLLAFTTIQASWAPICLILLDECRQNEEKPQNGPTLLLMEQPVLLGASSINILIKHLSFTKNFHQGHR
jgi:hypothetical protein